MVLMDRQVKLQQTAKAVDISIERATYILNVELSMIEVFARWVLLRLLTPGQKRARYQYARESLEGFGKNPTDFYAPFSYL